MTQDQRIAKIRELSQQIERLAAIELRGGKTNHFLDIYYIALHIRTLADAGLLSRPKEAPDAVRRTAAD